MVNLLNFLKEVIYGEVILKGNLYFVNLKLMKLLSYYIIPVIVLFTTVFIGNSINQNLIFNWMQLNGQAAFYLLIFVLYLKPISVIFPNLGVFRKLMMFRRQLGILVFYFGFSHFLSKVFLDFDKYTILGTLNFYIYGSIILGILLIMYLTSNHLAVRFLKMKWKLVQRLIYIGLIFLFIHIWFVYSHTYYNLGLLAGFWEGFGYNFYIVLYFILKGFEYKKVKFDFPKFNNI